MTFFDYLLFEKPQNPKKCESSHIGNFLSYFYNSYDIFEAFLDHAKKKKE